MRPDVADLHEFYASPLGQVARRLLRRRIRELWPDLRGQSILGLGFATPYLRPFLGEAERVVAVMPASQGVLHWPREAPNVVALGEETDLPLPDSLLDRVLLIHAIETTEELRPMLREIWRVLAPGGRLLAVAPNRRGLWSRVERTPFAQGTPYSRGQLGRLLRDNLFSPMRWTTALYVPPTELRFMLRSAAAIERIGGDWFSTFAGAILIEAGKQIYAATPLRESGRERRARVVVLPEA